MWRVFQTSDGCLYKQGVKFSIVFVPSKITLDRMKSIPLSKTNIANKTTNNCYTLFCDRAWDIYLL